MFVSSFAQFVQNIPFCSYSIHVKPPTLQETNMKQKCLLINKQNYNIFVLLQTFNGCV